MHAKQKDRQFWPQAMQVTQYVQPAFPRHTDVQNDYIPVLPTNILERFLRRTRLSKSHPGKCFRKGLSQASAHNGVIVGDENSHHGSFSGKASRGRGICNVTVVPEPGTPSIVSFPSSSRARSCIPTSPSDLRCLVCSGSKPMPLSWTRKIRCSFCLSRRAST